MFPLLLTLVGLGDIPSQNVGNRLSGFVGADEYIDLMPFLAEIGQCPIFKTADKTVGIGSRPERAQTGQSRKLLR